MCEHLNCVIDEHEGTEVCTECGLVLIESVFKQRNIESIGEEKTSKYQEFIKDVCHRMFIVDDLTLFRAGSGITLWGRAGQILPTSFLGYINLLNDLLVLRIYSQVNILDISSP